ncbi:MAG: transporter substrate-binding domain-containing protein [Rhodospirillaceae bacterium]|jgi:hypothetical protein|nr:transporter substrate-binding domain-containing protein [Rhodospirillaceae bacterium]MBT7772033.1 transporter substrate-binding domain-containing protein [Rhodospirillales bacterium]MBT4702656.1 transporter substrate-binding domain-containing protein [Rhodospirillaceae bacterium]MBT5035638.1 transporter substrate-binding domain-containing protein [Rhodospirillaceae bacterium]MBT6219378.1 transporter substrate-binding domain-containing protein [Rhodospirillaceae bacterium]
MRRLGKFAVFIILFMQFHIVAFAEEGMAYIHNAPESAADKRYEYHWKILRTALERTKSNYGKYSLTPSIPMSENRQAIELIKATGIITVMHLGTSMEFERKLVPIRIPVDKNLSGYMVYLIRKENQSKFSAVKNLDDLRKFTVGQGAGWLDVQILKHNGFNVVTGSNYDGLFKMLLAKRFNAFQRSAVEIIAEFDQRKGSMPNLHIEKDILFYYPLPMYFWFSNTRKGQRLADRAQEGMMSMIEDGTYDKIFMKYHKPAIDRLGLKNRTIFKVENPLLSPETPFKDKRLWYDPLKN